MVRTGATVGWAFRGFNPHHPKDPSYHPVLAHVAQTGHILRVKNRPGNGHDSKQAVTFLREVVDGLSDQDRVFALLSMRRSSLVIEVSL